MIYQITANTAPQALFELLTTMPGVARRNQSRNGEVFTVPYPTLLTIKDPTARVLFDPVRDANPFFHVMEFIWMMAGSDDVEFPGKFVKHYKDYAEDDGHVHGAYGRRWRYHFDKDQILTAIKLLKANPKDRQVVLGMWDPDCDLDVLRRDKPCNTQIYLRADQGLLDMTVCSRSNDAIWGMLGANVVHMTMLHEFISVATQIPIGVYQVFANNLLVYPHMVKNFEDLWSHPTKHDHYQPDHWDEAYVQPDQLLLNGEEPSGFLRACEQFIQTPYADHGYYFLNRVAKPMHEAFFNDKADNIDAADWDLACTEWLGRHR